MIIAAGNSISYFVLSDGFSNLIGRETDEQEKIGFPFEVWQRGKTYGRNLINFPAFYKNAAIGVGLGLALGVLSMLFKTKLNAMAEKIVRAEQNLTAPNAPTNPPTNAPRSPIESQSKHEPSGNQFSLGGLMVGTTIVAVIVGLATKLRPDPKVIAAIFFFAPVVMIAITMLPRRWSWQFRVTALTVLATSSIGVAIAVGSGLQMPFDEVLMGIFICWTPQGVVGTFLLLALLTWQGRENGK